MQQEKLKEVKARLNFEGCSRRNSKAQVVSQHSESRTPNVRGEHRRERRTGRSRSMPEGKGRRDEEYSIGWKIKEKVCSHTRKVVTRVTAREEQNIFPKNVTMKEHVHGGQKCSPKVNITEGDTGSQNQKSKGSCKGGTLGNAAWCHMFNYTLTGSARVWFDDLPLESIDSYDDLKKAFLANFLQQKKCIKDPVEIHHIKQREMDSTEDFVQRFRGE
nr:reverse transcriptase domain-containing protein [Tanacetum cinerariifolium]